MARLMFNGLLSSAVPLYIVCHHGNDSQLAVKLLRRGESDNDSSMRVKDIAGGLAEWSTVVDYKFPKILIEASLSEQQAWHVQHGLRSGPKPDERRCIWPRYRLLYSLRSAAERTETHLSSS